MRGIVGEWEQRGYCRVLWQVWMLVRQGLVCYLLAFIEDGDFNRELHSRARCVWVRSCVCLCACVSVHAAAYTAHEHGGSCLYQHWMLQQCFKACCHECQAEKRVEREVTRRLEAAAADESSWPPAAREEVGRLGQRLEASRKLTNSLQAQLEGEVAAHEREAISRASLQVRAWVIEHADVCVPLCMRMCSRACVCLDGVCGYVRVWMQGKGAWQTV